MKTKIFTFFALSGLLCAATAKADVRFEENFEYDADRVLIMDPIASSDNFDGITGWSTQSNKQALESRFTITDEPLTYPNYISSDIGNALRYTNQEAAGQSVFKALNGAIKADSVAYVSFMIRFPKTVDIISGGDFFFGLKMDANATENNWGARIYAKVEPEYEGEEITIGINKMSGGSTTWVGNDGPFLTFDKTYLFVIKYYVGKLNGTNADEEVGKFDDVMELFIDPELTAEPIEATLHHEDANQKDIFRYASSGKVIGGICSIYLRSNAAGNAPDYIIDGIRVGTTWTDAVGEVTAIKNVTTAAFSCYVDSSKQLHITSQSAFNNYEILTAAGQRVAQGTLSGNILNVAALNSGMYLIRLNGEQNAISKFIIQ